MAHLKNPKSQQVFGPFLHENLSLKTFKIGKSGHTEPNS